MFALLLLLVAAVTATPLDRFIEKEMKTGAIPGLSAVAVNSTHVLWTGVFGNSDPEKEKAATVDTLFTFASVSKTIISFVVMHLFDQGLVALDDDVNKHLDFTLKNPNFPNDPITLRQLLSHTSSINDDRYSSDAVYDHILVQGDYPGSIGTFLHALMVPGGNFYGKNSWHEYKPGARFDYSNIGATTAAHLAECVAKSAVRAGHGLGLGMTRADETTLDFNALAMALFRSNWPTAGPAAYHLANLSGTDIAIPSTLSREGKVKDYCLWGYPDYPDGTFRASPTTYSYLLRTFMNFGVAPGSGKQVLQRATAVMMRNVSDGAGDAPGQDGLPQALIWFYDDSYV